MSVPRTGVARVGMQRDPEPPAVQGEVVPRRLPPGTVIHPPPGSVGPMPEVVPRPPMMPPWWGAGPGLVGNWPNAVTPPWSWNWAQWYWPPWAPRQWRTTEDDWRWWPLWNMRAGIPNQTALAQWPMGSTVPPAFSPGQPILCRGCQAGWPFDENGRHIGPAPFPNSNRWDCQRVRWWGIPGASGFPLRWRSGWWQSTDFSTGDTAIWVRPWGSTWVPPLFPGQPLPPPGPGGGGGGTVTSPTVTLTPSATSIAAGGTVTLTWASTNATSWTASWGAVTTPSGTVTLSPAATTTYSITASGSGGTPASASTTVTVTGGVTPPPPTAADPTVVLSASPLTVVQGQAVTLTWSSTNANIPLVASGGWTGNMALAGSTTVTPAVTTTYTLTASGAAGTNPASQFVTVTVNPVTAFTPVTNHYSQVTTTGVVETVPVGAQNCVMEVWGTGGKGGIAGYDGMAGLDTGGGGGGSGGYCRFSLNVSAQAGNTFTVYLYGNTVAGAVNYSEIVAGTVTGFSSMRAYDGGNGAGGQGRQGGAGGAGGVAVGGNQANTTGNPGVQGYGEFVTPTSGNPGAGLVGVNGGPFGAGTHGQTWGGPAPIPPSAPGSPSMGRVLFHYT